jgi:hypothetical protein
MLFILFGISLIVFAGFVLFRHWENRLRISTLNHSAFQIPFSSNIQRVSIGERNNCSVGNTARHQFEDEILKWLRDAKPLSVTLPKLNGKLKSGGCSVPYTEVYLSTNTADHFSILPAFYISKENANSSNPKYEFHYVKNVIEIDDSNNHRYFFKSKNFYEWLMNN